MKRRIDDLLAKIKIKHYPYVAMVIAIVIVFMAFSFTSVVPGGYRMLYVSDFYGEYLNFLINLKHIFQGEQSFFYSWNIDMGMDIIGLNSYYMNSPLNLLILWLKEEYLMGGAVCLVILRVGLAAMTSYFCLEYIHNRRNSYKNNNDKYMMFNIVFISVCYSMCGWIITNFFNILWQDALFMLPIIVLYSIKIYDQNKIIGLIISYAYMFFSNYYMGYMIAIAGIIGLISFTIYKRKTIKEILEIVAKYIISLIIAAMICGVTLVPSFIQILDKLKENTKVSYKNIFNFDIFSFINGCFIGIYTSLENGNPAIYTGIVVLFLLVLYFVNEKCKKEKKYIVITLIMLIFSMSFQPINLIIHAFDEPDWFEFRYSYIFSFFISIVAVLSLNNSMNNIDERFIKKIKNIFVLINVYFCCYSIIVAILYKFIEKDKLTKYGVFKNSIITFIFNIVVINCLFILFVLFYKKKIVKKELYMLLMLLIAFENIINCVIIIENIDKESGFFKYEIVKNEADFLKKQVNTIKKEDTDFYRIESNYIVSYNDAYAIGYRGITNYTSVCNYNLNNVLSQLGIRVNGWRVDYEGSTPFLESIFNIKYMLHFAPQSWINETNIEDEFYVEKNNYYLPVGFMVSDNIVNYDISQGNNAIEKQNKILNAMLGDDEIYFKKMEYDINTDNVTRSVLKNNNVMYSKIDNSRQVVVNYSLPYNKNNRYYYSYYYDMSKGYYNGNIVTDYKISSKSESIAKQELKVPRTIFLNDNIEDNRKDNNKYNEKGDKEDNKDNNKDNNKEDNKLGLSITTNEQTMLLGSEGIYELDMDKYNEAYKSLSSDTLEVKETDNTSLKGKIKTDKKQVLFLSIPYNKGWKIQVDGKEEKAIPLINNAFMGVELEEGEHELYMYYKVPGLLLGMVLTLIGCSILFTLYCRLKIIV